MSSASIIYIQKKRTRGYSIPFLLLDCKILPKASIKRQDMMGVPLGCSRFKVRHCLWTVRVRPQPGNFQMPQMQPKTGGGLKKNKIKRPKLGYISLPGVPQKNIYIYIYTSDWGGLNQQKFISHSSGGWKPEVTVSAYSVYSGDSVLT